MQNPKFSKKLQDKWAEVMASLPELETLLKKEQKILEEKYLNKPVKIKNKGWNKGVIRQITINSFISLSLTNYQSNNRIGFRFEVVQHPDQRYGVYFESLENIELLEGDDLIAYEHFLESIAENKKFHERINNRSY